jgi:hypothetical protein
MFSVCVQVEALRRADHPSKESYRLSMIRKKNRSETESFHGGRPRPTGVVVPMEKKVTDISPSKRKEVCQKKLLHFCNVFRGCVSTKDVARAFRSKERKDA